MLDTPTTTALRQHQRTHRLTQLYRRVQDLDRTADQYLDLARDLPDLQLPPDHADTLRRAASILTHLAAELSVLADAIIRQPHPE